MMLMLHTSGQPLGFRKSSSALRTFERYLCSAYLRWFGSEKQMQVVESEDLNVSPRSDTCLEVL